MRVGRVALGVVLRAALGAEASPPAEAAKPHTLIVSRHSAGLYGDDHSADPSVSADARFVAFESKATNLVSVDTTNRDVFVHRRY